MPTNDTQHTELLLRRDVGVPDWSAARRRFAVRAFRDGLVDIAFEDHDTPLGRMRVSSTKLGIVRIVLPTDDTEAVLEELARKVSARILRTSAPTIAQARRELDEYFNGTRRGFDVPLDWALTRSFRRQVLEATGQIPYGETSSYRQIAVTCGSPNAVRAAGSALATNPLPILVPCHRVLRADGSLGQYRGGAAAKRQLLALERGA